jgi:hypothetical protein
MMKEFEVGDKVYLDTQGLNIAPKGFPTKLLPKRVGPFEILEKYSGLNYKLRLPEDWKAHPVFHISRLEEARMDPNPERDNKPKSLEFKNEEGETEIEYKVDQIIDRKLIRGRRDTSKAENYRYRVAWEGYGIEDATWEDYDNVEGLEAFEKYCDKEGLTYKKKELPTYSEVANSAYRV